MTESVNTETLDLEAIVAYLRHHPRFFEDHPNLLKKLHLRHESGDAISLIERQENRQLIDRLNQFIQVAQRNDRLFLKLQRLILELLPETRLNGLLERLQQGLQRDFDVHETTVILFDRAPGDGDGWLQTSRDQIAEAFPAVVDQGKAVCGALEPLLTQLLFANTEVGSIALAPLTRDQAVIGVLALGHTSPEHFRSGTETLFLTHLAQVTSLQMERTE